MSLEYSTADRQYQITQYMERLRKLVKAVCRGLIMLSVAWNNEQKLSEANDLIEAFSGEFIAWGMKPSMMLKYTIYNAWTSELKDYYSIYRK